MGPGCGRMVCSSDHGVFLSQQELTLFPNLEQPTWPMPPWHLRPACLWLPTSLAPTPKSAALCTWCPTQVLWSAACQLSKSPWFHLSNPTLPPWDSAYVWVPLQDQWARQTALVLVTSGCWWNRGTGSTFTSRSPPAGGRWTKVVSASGRKDSGPSDVCKC